MRFHRLRFFHVVVVVLAADLKRSAFAGKRPEMSAKLLFHERRKLFHAAGHVKVLRETFLPGFWPFWPFRSFATFGPFAANFRSFRSLRSVFDRRSRRNLFPSRRRSLPIGTEIVAGLGRECWRNDVPARLSVQRRVEVSVALNVATAPNGNLHKHPTINFDGNCNQRRRQFYYYFFYLVNINVHSFGLFERQQSVVIVDLDAV